MALDDSFLTRTRPKSTLPTALKPAPVTPQDEAPAALPPLDDLIPLPSPGEPYKAYARPDNKALLMLRFVLGDGSVAGFAYSDLRQIRILPGAVGQGPVLMLRFVEAVITEVRVEGRLMDAPADLLAYHRVGWLRELPPGKMHPDKHATVFTRFTFTMVEG
jgi:hypothetical protein